METFAGTRGLTYICPFRVMGSRRQGRCWGPSPFPTLGAFRERALPGALETCLVFFHPSRVRRRMGHSSEQGKVVKRCHSPSQQQHPLPWTSLAPSGASRGHSSATACVTRGRKGEEPKSSQVFGSRQVRRGQASSSGSFSMRKSPSAQTLLYARA